MDRINFNIPEYTKKALKLLSDGGFEGYLVGGCVRDFLMGIAPHDFDITTSALPEDMKRCFSEYRIIETGLKHGTLTVLIDGQNLEITTYRIDGEYSDNRHPKNVVFTKELSQDLSRRDFTVNAMAYNPEAGLVDVFGGYEDLKNHIIKCVGNPDKRFNEDGLRILRALRFASVLGFDIDPETSLSIKKNKDLLLNISSERIFSEFTKLICGKNAEKILLEYGDVISIFIPELKSAVGFEQNNPYHCYDVYTHTVKALSVSPADKIIRLALLFHDLGKPDCYSEDEKGGHFYGHHDISAEKAEQILRRLKSDNRTIKSVTRLVHDHDREIVPTEKAVRRVLSSMSFEEFEKLMEIKKADNLAQAPHVHSRQATLDAIIQIARDVKENEECLSLKTLAVNGDNLIRIGYKPGKELGHTLNFLLKRVIDGKTSNNKEELLRIARKNLSKHQ